MVWQSRWLIFGLALCIATSALGQGSAAGYGQQGGGGSGKYRGDENDEDAPNAGGFGGISPNEARPESEEGATLWQTKTAILTPGDRVEIKFKLKKGETLLASATSDAFDPALAIEDSRGTVLTKNDDRAEGDQSPFVIGRAPDDGTFTLKVLSFRAVSGGKFSVRYRTFASLTGKMGSTSHDRGPTEESSDDGRVIFRISATKGKIYDLGAASGLSQRQRYTLELIRILGPTGVNAADFELVPTGNRRPLFVALRDGDFYAEYRSYKSNQFQTDYAEASVVPATAAGQVDVEISPGQLKIVEFPVQPGLIVRTTISGEGFSHTLSAPAGPNFRRDDGSDPSYGNTAFWTRFRMNRDSDQDVVRIFRGTGTARLVLISTSGKPQKLKVNNTNSLPVWNSADAVKSKLAIGDCQLFILKSSKSELMHVSATATHFQPRLNIYRQNGELANSLSDRKTHDATDDLYFPDEDTFFVRLSCDGDGGSGDFTLRRDILGAAAYNLGATQTMKLDGANFGLYAVELEAGKRYQLTTDEPDAFLRTDLLDEDGQFLVSQRIRFDKVEVQYFVPTRSGKHRLWLRGGAGTRHFRFELHKPPAIGG